MSFRNLKLNELTKITSIFYLEKTEKGLNHYVKKDGNFENVGFEEFPQIPNNYNKLYW